MRLILFCLALTSLTANAQLNGAYTRDGEVYNFRGDGSFDWIKTESEVTYGNGSYKVNGKKLELTFDKSRLQYDLQLAEIGPDLDGKCVIEIRIMYSNGQPASGASVILPQSNIRQFVNADGILKLELSNPPEHDNLEIEVGGRKSTSHMLQLKGNNFLFGIVVDETVKYRENVEETFAFKQKRGKIILNKKPFNKTTTL